MLVWGNLISLAPDVSWVIVEFGELLELLVASIPSPASLVGDGILCLTTKNITKIINQSWRGLFLFTIFKFLSQFLRLKHSHDFLAFGLVHDLFEVFLIGSSGFRVPHEKVPHLELNLYFILTFFAFGKKSCQMKVRVSVLPDESFDLTNFLAFFSTLWIKAKSIKNAGNSKFEKAEKYFEKHKQNTADNNKKWNSQKFEFFNIGKIRRLYTFMHIIR